MNIHWQKIFEFGGNLLISSFMFFPFMNARIILLLSFLLLLPVLFGVVYLSL